MLLCDYLPKAISPQSSIEGQGHMFTIIAQAAYDQRKSQRPPHI